MTGEKVQIQNSFVRQLHGLPCIHENNARLGHFGCCLLHVPLVGKNLVFDKMKYMYHTQY